jgi:hypothetical protein
VLSAFPNDYNPLAGLRRAGHPFHVNRDFGDEQPSITGAEFVRRTLDEQELARLIEERGAQNHRVWEEQQKMRINKERILHLRTKIAAAADQEANQFAPEEARRGPRFYELLAELRDLHDRKAHDYAPGEDRFKNFRGCESLGIPAYEGAIVRMLDKVSRITNLVERGKKGDAPAVVDESLIDTFRDLSCYALICIELYEDHCARSA